MVLCVEFDDLELQLVHWGFDLVQDNVIIQLGVSKGKKARETESRWQKIIKKKKKKEDNSTLVAFLFWRSRSILNFLKDITNSLSLYSKILVLLFCWIIFNLILYT